LAWAPINTPTVTSTAATKTPDLLNNSIVNFAFYLISRRQSSRVAHAMLSLISR